MWYNILMTRKYSFGVGEFYHLYNRGNDRREIFLHQKDHERFIRLLFLCNGTKPVSFKETENIPLSEIDRGEPIVDIGVYCLMTNHFHLLVREKQVGGISLFMKKISTAYSMYFNMKYDRTGKLYENAFKATHVDDDEYLRYLFAYIHLNPIKLFDPHWRENGIADRFGAKQYLKEYAYSSYLDYIGITREESAILGREAFPEYFSKKAEFETFIDEWLLFSKQEDI